MPALDPEAWTGQRDQETRVTNGIFAAVRPCRLAGQSFCSVWRHGVLHGELSSSSPSSNERHRGGVRAARTARVGVVLRTAFGVTVQCVLASCPFKPACFTGRAAYKRLLAMRCVQLFATGWPRQGMWTCVENWQVSRLSGFGPTVSTWTHPERYCTSMCNMLLEVSRPN